MADDVRGGAGTPPPLTERELAVLELLGDGRSDGEIAAILDVSEQTVSIHSARIIAKLGVSSRAAAVEWARANGLLGDAGSEEDHPSGG